MFFIPPVNYDDGVLRFRVTNEHTGEVIIVDDMYWFEENGIRTIVGGRHEEYRIDHYAGVLGLWENDKCRTTTKETNYKDNKPYVNEGVIKFIGSGFSLKLSYGWIPLESLRDRVTNGHIKMEVIS